MDRESPGDLGWSIGGSAADNPTPLIIDLAWVEQATVDLVNGQREQVDLSGLLHEQATHADLVPPSMLAWWLLGTQAECDRWSFLLPPRGSAALRHLARSGLIAAATERDVRLTYTNGEVFEVVDLLSDPSLHQPRLPGIDWEVLDELVSGDRMRLIPDLADPQRRVPNRSAGGLYFPWLENLGLKTSAISADGYSRFLADADTAISELIDNVHRWSGATRAFAVASVTRGGGTGDDGEDRSWNRLHLVVADNGVGVPTALRSDLRALAAVHEASPGTLRLESIDDVDLVGNLLRHAFGGRRLPNHNGHGLNATQIRAGQWVGAVDVATVNCDGAAIRIGIRGLSPRRVDRAYYPDSFPHVRGTMVHVLLQATDKRTTRHQAALQEALPFAIDDFDEASELLYDQLAEDSKPVS